MESWSRRSASGINRTESAFQFFPACKEYWHQRNFYDLTKLDLDGFWCTYDALWDKGKMCKLFSQTCFSISETGERCVDAAEIRNVNIFYWWCQFDVSKAKYNKMCNLQCCIEVCLMFIVLTLDRLLVRISVVCRVQSACNETKRVASCSGLLKGTWQFVWSEL